MTGESAWVPPGVDTKRANAARVYDYWLGGTHNFLAAQDLARSVAAVQPDAPVFARAGRAFLGRAVRFLAAAGIGQFLDIGLLLVAVLHFIADADDPWRIVATLRDALAPGSYLVLGHASHEGTPTVAHAAQKVYNRNVSTEIKLRSRAEILRFFDGFHLVEPGLVHIPQWRPDSAADVPADPSRFWGLAGVGRKP